MKLTLMRSRWLALYAAWPMRRRPWFASLTRCPASATVSEIVTSTPLVKVGNVSGEALLLLVELNEYDDDEDEDDDDRLEDEDDEDDEELETEDELSELDDSDEDERLEDEELDVEDELSELDDDDPVPEP